MKYVIIGNSTAAVACIEGIRGIDTQGEITVISAEKHAAYGRPLISYYLSGRIKRENMNYRPADFYAKNGVDLMLGKTATSIDAKEKFVALDDGNKIPYDKLLVATGSRPFVPPMEGLDGVKSKFSFMTYDDMLALEAALSPEKKVLVIGAGLIGLKCVEGILQRVKSISVVDMANRILPSILDEGGSLMVQKTLEEKGVKFYLNDSAAKFENNTACLKSGAKIPFDILVVAVGVRPNTELVKDIGGAVNRGIVVDECMRTYLPDIYSAGDCAEGFDSVLKQNRVLAILPNAYFQGKTAGVNMAGGEAKLTNAIPMNAIGFFDTHVLTAGIYEGECYSHVTDKVYKKLFVKDGKLAGFILINDFLRAGIYTSLIRNATPLDSVDFNALLKQPELMAFSKEDRKIKLAKKV
ncbi:MAG: FAD-dependent oxidoreductase [Clostridia bacterium]|nr:FAD-dependent oxidoreductase [Clostridia bacterium]